MVTKKDAEYIMYGMILLFILGSAIPELYILAVSLAFYYVFVMSVKPERKKQKKDRL